MEFLKLGWPERLKLIMHCEGICHLSAPLLNNPFKDANKLLTGKQLAPLCFPNSMSVLARSSVFRFCSIFATFPSWIWKRLWSRFCHRCTLLQWWHPVFYIENKNGKNDWRFSISYLEKKTISVLLKEKKLLQSYVCSFFFF